MANGVGGLCFGEKNDNREDERCDDEDGKDLNPNILVDVYKDGWEEIKEMDIPSVRKRVDDRHARKRKLSKYVLAKVRQMKLASHATVLDDDATPKVNAEWRMYAMSLRSEMYR